MVKITQSFRKQHHETGTERRRSETDSSPVHPAIKSTPQPNALTIRTWLHAAPGGAL